MRKIYNFKIYQEMRKKESIKRDEKIRKQFAKLSAKNLKPGYIIQTLMLVNKCSRSTVYAALPIQQLKKNRHTGNAGVRPVGKA